MPILDCSTRASTLRSLSAGFGCSPSSLSVALLAFDLDALYETDLHIDIPPEEYLYHYACERFGAPADYSSAYWFHGTRTVPGNLFSDGLLSLEQSEKRVMDMLIALAPDTEVSNRLQKWNVHGGVPEEMFRMRTLDPAHWDPMATSFGKRTNTPAYSASMSTSGYPNWSKTSAGPISNIMAGICPHIISNCFSLVLCGLYRLYNISCTPSVPR
ncbi:TPA: hypothetical protein ACSP0P_003869 [Citrobacter freundii]